MNTLYNEVISFIDKDEKIKSLMDSISRNANIYLFGGAVRDYLDSNFCHFRDLDFVIEFNDSNLSIENFLNDSFKFKKNHFNGYKFMSKYYCIDIWELKDTWAFRENLYPITIENLFKTVYFNVDKVIYSMTTQTYVNDCNIAYEEIMKNKILDVVLTNNPMIELNLLRAIKICQKYDMDISDKLKSIFIEQLQDESFISKLQFFQQSHYGEDALSKPYFQKIIYQLLNK